MRNLLAHNRNIKGAIVKWSGWLVALGLLSGIGIYASSIKEQLWFTVVNPKVVNFCMEGYEGEHGEADRRFEMKQKGELISPLAEEAKKE